MTVRSRVRPTAPDYTTQIGHRPAPSEVASWQNSLMARSMLLDQAELDGHGVIGEYQFGTGVD